MLNKTEIALLQLATNEINKRESVKVPNEKKKSGLFLYNSLVKYGLTQTMKFQLLWMYGGVMNLTMF